MRRIRPRFARAAHIRRTPPRALACLALALLAIFAAGCGDPAADEAGAGAPAVVTLYLPDAAGERLVAAERALAPGEDPLAAALDGLAAARRGDGAGPGLPEGARVRSARIAGGIARVDLDAGFARAYPAGGAAAEIAVLAPMVLTLTGLPGVRAVLLLVEGRPPDLPGSAFDLSQPLRRSDLPADLVRTP